MKRDRVFLEARIVGRDATLAFLEYGQRERLSISGEISVGVFTYGEFSGLAIRVGEIRLSLSFTMSGGIKALHYQPFSQRGVAVVCIEE